jgi:hypothetical protein
MVSMGNVSLLPPIGLPAVPDAIDGNYLGGIVYVVDDPVLAHPQPITFHSDEFAGARRPGSSSQPT